MSISARRRISFLPAWGLKSRPRPFRRPFSWLLSACRCSRFSAAAANTDSPCPIPARLSHDGSILFRWNAMPSDYPMISYSQNFEDVVLARVFADVSSGFYVDVGANHPERDSVTKHSAIAAGRGINMEPGRDLRRTRRSPPAGHQSEPGGIRCRGECHVLRRGPPGGIVGGSTPRCRSLCGSSSASGRPRHGAGPLPLSDSGTARSASQLIFLSVDVEGHERAGPCCSATTGSGSRPKVVLVDGDMPGTTTPCHEEWEDILLDADYQFSAYFDGLNRFYVRGEDAGRFAAAVRAAVRIRPVHHRRDRKAAGRRSGRER